MQVKISNAHWSPSPFTDWAAFIGEDEDQIVGYGRTAIEALEDLKNIVCDDEQLVEMVERRIIRLRREHDQAFRMKKVRA